jgi:hypothetical protein
MADEQPIVGRSKHGELTLDQLAELQPGLGALMREVSDRYWICYYAAQQGNWDLAAYQLRALRSVFAKGSLTRPKYQAMLEEYNRRVFEPLQQAVAANDSAAFAKEYQAGIALANQWHVATKHGEIVWQLPAQPPLHLQLTRTTT